MEVLGIPVTVGAIHSLVTTCITIGTWIKDFHKKYSYSHITLSLVVTACDATTVLLKEVDDMFQGNLDLNDTVIKEHVELSNAIKITCAMILSLLETHVEKLLPVTGSDVPLAAQKLKKWQKMMTAWDDSDIKRLHGQLLSQHELFRTIMSTLHNQKQDKIIKLLDEHKEMTVRNMVSIRKSYYKYHRDAKSIFVRDTDSLSSVASTLSASTDSTVVTAFDFDHVLKQTHLYKEAKKKRGRRSELARVALSELSTEAAKQPLKPLSMNVPALSLDTGASKEWAGTTAKPTKQGPEETVELMIRRRPNFQTSLIVTKEASKGSDRGLETKKSLESVSTIQASHSHNDYNNDDAYEAPTGASFARQARERCTHGRDETLYNIDRPHTSTSTNNSFWNTDLSGVNGITARTNPVEAADDNSRSRSRERITQMVLEKLAARPVKSRSREHRPQVIVGYEPDTRPPKERCQRSSRIADSNERPGQSDIIHRTGSPLIPNGPNPRLPKTESEKHLDSVEIEISGKHDKVIIQCPRSWTFATSGKRLGLDTPASIPSKADVQAWTERIDPDGTRIRSPYSHNIHWVTPHDSFDNLLAKFGAELDFILVVPHSWIMQNASAIEREADLQERLTNMKTWHHRNKPTLVYGLQVLSELSNLSNQDRYSNQLLQATDYERWDTSSGGYAVCRFEPGGLEIGLYF